MATYDEVIRRWHERLTGINDRQNLTNHRMPVNDDAIFSYGSHFPLAVATRNRRGEPTALILNGDRWGPTTSKHQGMVRSMADRSHLPHVIVPFEALRSAGIDPVDIEIVEVTPDRVDTTTVVRHDLPGGTRWDWYRFATMINVDADEIEARLDADLVKRTADWHTERTSALQSAICRRKDLVDQSNPDVAPSIFGMIARLAAGKLMAVLTGVPFIERAPWDWEFTSTWRAATWPTKAYPTRRTADEMDGAQSNWQSAHWRQDRRVVRSDVVLANRGGWVVTFDAFGFEPSAPEQVDLDELPPVDDYGLRGVLVGVGAALIGALTGNPVVTFTHTRTRHWLGGSLLKAKIRHRGYTRCKACNGTSLKDGVTREDYRGAGFPASMQCETCQGAGGKHWTRSRTAYFISDFDAQEPNPLYFFCELPPGVKPTTLEDAIEALKPEPVLVAEQEGRSVERQGDIFAIELAAINRKALKAANARFEKMGELLGTNHVATEVAHLPNGVTVARGTLHHRPPHRRPDHVRHKLGEGKTWHVVTKNTVPVTA